MITSIPLQPVYRPFQLAIRNTSVKVPGSKRYSIKDNAKSHAIAAPMPAILLFEENVEEERTAGDEESRQDSLDQVDKFIDCM